MIEEENRIAELLIGELLEDYLFEPQRGWPKREFENRSYERWAALDILRRIEEEPYVGPINIIQGFIEDMDDFEELSDEWKTVRIFRIAKETATDILKLLL